MSIRTLAKYFPMLLAVCAIAAAGGAAPAATIYVSSGALELGTGQMELPFGSIARAQEEVRKKLAAGAGDITVVLMSGTYRLTEPLVFGPADGGNDKHSVTYMVEAGDKAVISGGVEIKDWEDKGDGTWAAEVPASLLAQTDPNADGQAHAAFTELFVGKQRRSPARHPNQGYLRVDKAVDQRKNFLFKDGDIPAVKDASRATLVFLHDWEISRVAVESIDQAQRKLTTKYPVGCKPAYWGITGYEPHPRYFVEGAREFLDAPGEWCIDGNRVLYKPMPDEEIDGFKAVVPLAKQLLIVRGEGQDKPVRNLRFRGVSFEHCNWQPAGYRYAGSQAGFHYSGKDIDDSKRGSITPAVDVQNARGVKFENCTLSRLGGVGVWLGRGCRDSSLVGCTVSDLGGNGVMLGEPTARTEAEGLSGGNTVRNCLIERCGAVYFGSVGVWVGLSDNNVIANNEIRDLPYTGVSVGWMWNPSPTPCKANTVANNHIHHVMGILSA